MSKPKISLNKLGEYLDATPSRRKRIIQDQQNPQAFKAVRYQDARECITEYISNEMLDDAGLLESAQKLRAVHDCSDFILQFFWIFGKHRQFFSLENRQCDDWGIHWL